MTLRQHLWLSIALEFLAFLAGAVLAIWLAMFGFAQGWHLFGKGMLLFGAVLGPTVAVRMLMRQSIGCRCVAEGCSGRMHQTGSDPIRYVCRACGHEEETAVFEGDSALHHDRRNRP